MTITSKIYENYQTTIPSEIRKRCNINKDDLIEWSVNKNCEPEIRFRKKVKLEDIRAKGHLNYETNSTELVRELYK